MTIELAPDTERLLEEILGRGEFADANAVVAAALRRFAGTPNETEGLRVAPEQRGEIFRRLRREIEESGIPLLNDEELRAEIAERKGRRY